jgi:hypothetical protein
MNELLLNDETLTTADIAHPETVREVRAATIEDGSLLPARVKPVPEKTTEVSAGPLFPDDELHNFRASWDQVQTSFGF